MITYLQLVSIALWTLALTCLAIVLIKVIYKIVCKVIASRKDKLQELERRYDQLDCRCNKFNDVLTTRVNSLAVRVDELETKQVGKGVDNGEAK